jgi:26S proteasome regulatory subunit N5
MKVLLQKQDFIRMFIVSNKINRKFLNDDTLVLLKLDFYQLMIKYYLHEKQFIDVAKSYKSIYDFLKEIELRLTNPQGLKEEYIEMSKKLLSSVDKLFIFTQYVMFLNICPPELETKNMLNELNMFYRKDLDSVSDMDLIIKTKLSEDIIFIDDNCLSVFTKYPIFNVNNENVNGKEHFILFRKSLIQHNLLIFQKFFSNMNLSRISKMTNVQQTEVESELAEMVINHYIFAKINRTTGTIAFRQKLDGNGKLANVGLDLTKMLKTLEKTCHLIHKENLKYDIKS